ncbi:hypothetical protein [Imperialibacter roseus]|uniref:Uncharacterized protein n=1 Tax=Imperialibacter roseus TaxID=1324217 RepID=A0ABZ0J0J3_9BACT|nr:hypothetical protein [Imperialibacter roseus]WOK09700.1 hypothetical protein RT717_13740 [Imperialibacter roseus]|tara:strand:+ start:39134 stop:39397 length:264 start_codon:yes stop_codon:yes gene_type:complete
MPSPPEAFLIFKTELKRLELEKERLRIQYEQRISLLNKELDYLKEQINSQESMLKSAFDYASKLEQNMKAFKEDIIQDKARLKESRH